MTTLFLEREDCCGGPLILVNADHPLRGSGRLRQDVREHTGALTLRAQEVARENNDSYRTLAGEGIVPVDETCPEIRLDSQAARVYHKALEELGCVGGVVPVSGYRTNRYTGIPWRKTGRNLQKNMWRCRIAANIRPGWRLIWGREIPSWISSAPRFRTAGPAAALRERPHVTVLFCGIRRERRRSRELPMNPGISAMSVFPIPRSWRSGEWCWKSIWNTWRRCRRAV